MLLRLVLANKHQLSLCKTNTVHAQLQTAVLREIVPCINTTRLRLVFHMLLSYSPNISCMHYHTINARDSFSIHFKIQILKHFCKISCSYLETTRKTSKQQREQYCGIRPYHRAYRDSTSKSH